MPQDAAVTSEERSKPSRSRSEATQTSSQWFTTPHSIRCLFDKFPLRIYPVNELPQRSQQKRDRHTLWIFTTDKGAQLGAPSFNPGCLKWQASWQSTQRWLMHVLTLTPNYQTYLKFQDVSFVTISSNNHASPTGALPFLLPASNFENVAGAVLPIPSNRIEHWVCDQNASKDSTGRSSARSLETKNHQAHTNASTEHAPTSKESLDVRYEAYMALLNYRIRNAYVGPPSDLVRS